MATTYWSIDDCCWVAYEPDPAQSAHGVPAPDVTAPVPGQRPSAGAPREVS